MVLLVQLSDSLACVACKSDDLNVSCVTWGDSLTVNMASGFVPVLVQVFVHVVSEDGWSVILLESLHVVD